MKYKAVLFDEATLNRSITRIAHEILEKNDGVDNLCLIGIKTRGVPIADRLKACIQKIEGKNVPVGYLDVTQFRDDFKSENDSANIHETQIPFSVQNMHIVLVDDVFYTGRTIRSALDAIIKHGRPSTIQLAVLVDRGHREFPIRPDYIGKNIPTSKSEIVKVSLLETDGIDKIELYEI